MQFVFTGQKRNKTWLRRKGNYAFFIYPLLTKQLKQSLVRRVALLLGSTPGSRALLAQEMFGPNRTFLKCLGTDKASPLPNSSLCHPFCDVIDLHLCEWIPDAAFSPSVKLANPFGHGPEPEAPGNVLLTFSCSICTLVQCRGPNTAVRHSLAVRKGKT